MQTIKTAIVVVLLLVVLYGAYDVLTRPEPTPPPEVAALLEDAEAIEMPEISVDSPVVVTPGTSTEASPATGLSSGEPAGTPIAPQPPVASSVPPQPVSSPTPAAPAAPDVPGDMKLKQNPFYNEKPAEMPSGTAPNAGNAAAAPSSDSHDDAGHDHAGHDHAAASAGDDASGAADASGPTDSDGGSNRGFSPPGATSFAPPSPAGGAPAGSEPTAGERAFLRVKQAAQSDIQSGKYVDALRKLSVFYRSPDLSADEQAELLNLLDPLAARVVYSRESLLTAPYETRHHDTLLEIAKAYRVPWRLLQKINGVADPQVIVPGTKLKVVPGPFRAEVYLADGELTLFLGELYAGRFPVTIGRDPSPQPKVYHVKDKQTARTYYGRGGRTIPAGSPLNPFGSVWIDLGNDVSIHGSPAQPSQQATGCIGLSPKDADDVYSILSIGSEVKIRP